MWKLELKVVALYALVIIGVMIIFGSCFPLFGLTAQVTWDIGDEDDLYGYTFLYRVDNGPWLPHRDGFVIPLENMTQVEGRTGRRFTAPDNGKTFRIQPLAVDDTGNISLCGRVVVIDTFHQTVTTEECE